MGRTGLYRPHSSSGAARYLEAKDMMLEARQAFPDTDTTMQNPTDFRDLYRRKVMLPEVGGRVYVLLHGSCWAEVEVGSSSKIDADVVEGGGRLPRGGLKVRSVAPGSRGGLPQPELAGGRGGFSPPFHPRIPSPGSVES